MSDQNIIQIIIYTITVAGVYWKLNQRVAIIETMQKELTSRLDKEITDRKDMQMLMNDTHKELRESNEAVKKTLHETNLAITKLDTTLNMFMQQVKK